MIDLTSPGAEPKRMSSDQAGGKPKKSKLSNEENGERANS